MKSYRFFTPAAFAVALAASSSAHATLTSFQTFVGNYGVSTAGWGSTSQSGQITANVPVGDTVVAAYLYTSTYNDMSGAGGTFGGTAVNYTPLSANAGDPVLQAGRTDVTSIVAPIIDGGAGGVYNFNVTETSPGQDGEALVVVYKQASLPTTTIGILDGSSATTGDTTSINFSKPLDPTSPGFIASMALGIGFSYDGTNCTGAGQSSTITVNGTTITNNAGCNDSSVDATPANGNLITVGGYINGFTTSILPSIANDHEMYNIVPQITKGDTKITVNTLNPSNNDNIFLAVFNVSGEAGINVPPPNNNVPEPSTLGLFGLALLSFGFQRKLAKRS